MKNVEIDLVQLFNHTNNVRNYLTVDIADEDRSYLIDRYEIDDEIIDEILKVANMYFTTFEKVDMVVTDGFIKVN